MAYADARFWDQYFRELAEAGDDLDWEGLWTGPFLTPLREAETRTVLELGCGTGNDAARLAREGYQVTAADLSAEAVARARARYGHAVSFLVADMARPLPFPDASFDAVMSNVALHMFPDAVTRSVFAEVGRLVRPGGLFLFHVNATEDRALRARWRPVTRELEPDFVLEKSGQTMHFFSEPYLRELLRQWSELLLDPVEITHPETGQKFKHVWRGIAHRLPVLPGTQQLRENLCLAVLEVLRRGQQRHRAGLSLITQVTQGLGLFRFCQLGFIAAPELGELSGVMAVPAAQLIRRRHGLEPLVQVGFFLGQSARPQPVHQHAPAIGRFGLLVNASCAHLLHGAIIPSRRSTMPEALRVREGDPWAGRPNLRVQLASASREQPIVEGKIHE